MKKFFSKDKTGSKPFKRTLISKFDTANRFKHWYMGGLSLFRSLFRVHAAKQTVIIILSILSVAFIMAAFYTNSGEFVIKVNREMSRDGFYLSEIPNFDEHLTTLKANALTDATNISVYNIESNVMDVDGEHHTRDCFAYTFYVKNLTGETKDYRYTLFIRSKTKGIEEAAWIMLFHNGKQEIFAKMGKDGNPETQYSDYEFPFQEYALYPQKQQTTISNQNPGYITQDVIDAHEYDS